MFLSGAVPPMMDPHARPAREEHDRMIPRDPSLETSGDAAGGEMPFQAGGVWTLQAPPVLDTAGAEDFLRRLEDLFSREGDRVVLDLGRVENFDSAGLSVLVRAVFLGEEMGKQVRFARVPPEILDYFSLVSLERLVRAGSGKPPREGFLSYLGGLAVPGLEALKLWFYVTVETFWGVVVRPFKGERIRWDRVVEEISAVGAGAVPLVFLIGFLMGLILVMQTAGSLRAFGAEVYVADMVGISITREIGPLMTAILVAARSGSSIAAEIGTMVVSEEVDALRQMGIHPVRFLVLPKIVALAVSTPCLGVIFNLCAILGGLLFAVVALGLPWGVYLDHTQAAITQYDILEGVFKCAVFGSLVGQVGCALGLGVQGGSIGVARATTFSVVLSIFLVIVFDAFFVALFRML